MANPVVESSQSTITNTDASSVTITKPTGLAVGDIMFAYVATFDTSVHTHTTPAGWTLVEAPVAASGRRRLSSFYKVADSGDVAASNFTFSFSASVDKLGGAIIRTSGGVTGGYLSDSFAVEPTSGTTFNVSTSLTPASGESLVLTTFMPVDFEWTVTPTGTSYTLTPTTSMVEVVDVGIRDGGDDGFGLFIARGAYSSTSEITNYGFTSGENFTSALMATVIVLYAPQNATATNALFETSPDTFATLTGSTQSPGNDFQAISPNIFTQSARANSPTAWTNDPKNTTDWTNEDESS